MVGTETLEEHDENDDDHDDPTSRRMRGIGSVLWLMVKPATRHVECA